MMKNLLPRHYVFLGLFVLTALVMSLNIKLDVEVSENTKRLYGFIDSLPENSYLIVSFDHEASSIPEIKPIATALLKHAFSKGHKLIGLSLFSEGTLIGYRLMSEIGREYDRKYGQDYVYLGFKPQYIAAILSMGESIPKTFPKDYLGNKYSDIPILSGIENYDDVSAVLSIADGSLTTHWIEYAGMRYNIAVVAGVAAAMVTTYDPYLEAGQMHSMIGGLRGAAEYEKMLGYDGGGARAMLAQTTAHLYVILMIIIGNVIYFRNRKKGIS